MIQRWDPNKVDLGVMPVKVYCTFFQTSGLEPHHQIVLCQIQNTRLVECYPSAEMQSAYSTVSTDCDFSCNEGGGEAWEPTKIKRSKKKNKKKKKKLKSFFYNFDEHYHFVLILIAYPVRLGCRIHRLHLCRGVRPHPQRVS